MTFKVTVVPNEILGTSVPKSDLQVQVEGIPLKKLLHALVALLVVTSSLVGSQAAEATPLTWQTATQSAVGSMFEAVAYGNGTFVGISASKIATSPDGRTWILRDFPEPSPECRPLTTSWIALTYGGGLFVAVGWGGSCSDKVMTSPDGISWSVRSAPGADFLDSVAYGNGRYVAADRSGGILSSPDGISWTRHDAPGSWWGITYGNGTYVAVGKNSSDNAATATSTDGISWDVVDQGNIATNSSISFGNGTFVVVQPMGEGALGLLSSADGRNWIRRTLPGTGWAVAFGNGRFQVVGFAQGAGLVHYSTDGIDWIAETATVGPLINIAFGNGMFLASDISGAVMTASAPAPVASISSGSTPNSQVAAIPAGVTSATLPATAELPTVSLNFAAAGGSATATVAPIANPASASNTPFTITGTTKIVDIQVTGVTGPVTVCLDGASTDDIFHYTGGAWVSLPQRSYVNGQVCGVTSSFSPFTAAAPTSSVSVTQPTLPVLNVSRPAPAIAINARPAVSTTGQSLTLKGENLADVTAVKVAGKEVKISKKASGELTIELPAGEEGFPDLEIIHAGGAVTMQGLIQVVKPYGLVRTQKITKFKGNLPVEAGKLALEKAYLKGTTVNILTCVATVASDASAAEIAKTETRAKATCARVVNYAKYIKTADIHISKDGAAGSNSVLAITFDRTLGGK